MLSFKPACRHILTFAASAMLAATTVAQDIPLGFEEGRSIDAVKLAQLIDPVREALASRDVASLSVERERLLERLRNPRASSRFRLDLSDGFVDDLKGFAASDDQLIGLGALDERLHGVPHRLR